MSAGIVREARMGRSHNSPLSSDNVLLISSCNLLKFSLGISPGTLYSCHCESRSTTSCQSLELLVRTPAGNPKRSLTWRSSPALETV
jgi:hypothetical protein